LLREIVGSEAWVNRRRLTSWASHTVVVPTEAVAFKYWTDGQEANACDAASYSRRVERRRHESVQVVGQWLTRVVRGYFNYHAVSRNLMRLGGFRLAACRLWRQALKRRSQGNRLQLSRYGRLADFYIPRPRNAHPYPEDRFASHTRGRSRMR
jgi:hypothetical protein